MVVCGAELAGPACGIHTLFHCFICCVGSREQVLVEVDMVAAICMGFRRRSIGSGFGGIVLAITVRG